MRILLFTGKGGVGKTTVAAATAVRSSEAGRRTLVLSTDPAHSLADAFDRPIADAPTRLGSNLSGQQLDARSRLEDGWADVRDYLVEVLDWAGADALEAEELSVVPGLDEVFALSDIKSHAESGDWDVLVVDCAPTAETIRLLSLPDVIARYMERIFPAQRALTKAARPVLQKVTDLPIARDSVFAATQRFYERLDGVRELLTDAEVTTARLVVNPERVVVAEARRTFTYLSLFGYHVDAVVANRLLPEQVTDPWFEEWKRIQKQQLDEIHDAFSPVPVLPAPLAPDELVGAEPLASFAADLYDDGIGIEHLYRDDPMGLDADGDALVFSMRLPFVEQGALDLARVDGDLLVAVGPYRRAVTLPDSLRRREVSSARIVGDRLEVEFSEGRA